MIPQTLPSHRTILWAAILIVVHTVAINADSTDGTTPLALKPGAPAGSYALSELDNINPYNGSLNFRLPLLSIGGRGGAGYTMTLPLEQKWRINVVATYLTVYEGGGGSPLPDPQVTYHYFPSANWWAGIKPGYGPGVMQGRVAQFDAQVCQDSTMRAVQTLTRLTFTAPDGTEFELQDKQTDGAPAGVGICATAGFNRGRIFVTADGSVATFVSDQAITDYIWVPNGGNDLFYPSGYLLLRDGMRYRIDNGVVSWLRDRNGNKMTFTYDSFKRMTVAKDSLNREVTVAYSTSSIPYDEISYKGFGGMPRTVRVNYANLQDAGVLRSGFSVQTYQQLFPEVSGSWSTNYNPKIVRSVTLPNAQQYQFQYNSYGELARVVLPTSGAFEYDYAAGVSGGAASGVIGGGFEESSINIYRRVTTRRVYADGITLAEMTTFSGQNLISGNTNYVLIDQFRSDGTTRINRQKIYYEGFAANSFNLGPTEYSPWKDGKEYQSDSIAENGSTVLRRAVRTWQQPVAGALWPLTQAETNAAVKANNPQITEIFTTLEPAQANKVSKQTFGYDKYANQTDVYEYDYGSGTAGPLVRRSHTDYLASSYDTLNPTSANPDLNLTSHIRNLATQVSIFDAGGVERARSTTEYDNYVLDGADCLHSFHCPLQSRTNISGFDALSYTMRGNPTRSTRYLLTNGAVTGAVSSYSHYDVAGNVIRAIDPRSTVSNFIVTSIDYDDRFGVPDTEARANSVPSELIGFTSFAFPTKVTNPLGHTTYAQFDYYLGQPVNGEDANGVVTSGQFNDLLDRPKQIRRAIGTGAENQTTFNYDDVLRLITISSDKDAFDDNLLVSKIKYDQLGRTTESRQYEGGGNYIVTETQYDALGRAFKTSNPYRPLQSETAVWTTQAFDALGRVVSVTTPDNAIVNTSYSGNNVTVTDQTGKARKSVTDALGRLTNVYEDPNGASYQTTYAYDVLDDLTTVTQGIQTRTFGYDSLKRLLSATNPENGTITYEYDSNSNLRFRTDARGVVTENRYDALNRVTTVLYRINGQPDPNTGDVEYLYDNATNGKGRLWATYRWGAKPSHTAVGLYDAMGRVTQLYNVFGDGLGGWSAGYAVNRTYNRAGAITTQSYPSGHAVTYNYDNAGRLADKDAQNLAFTGNLGDGVPRTYSRGITYASAGQLKQEQFGTTTPVYNKLFYNSRLQLAEILTSTTGNDSSWNRGKILNQYSLQCSGAGCNATDNNGNLRKQEMFVPANDQVSSYTSWYQQYDYDALNRLQRVHEYTSNVQLDWQQEFMYDQWGNRRIDVANTYGPGINNRNFEKQDTTNRLYAPGDIALADSLRRIRYDAGGNQIKDTYTGYGAATFDAENRIVAIQDILAGWSYYTYNADGQRVRRKIGNQETWQIYGIDGELLAEYAANGAVANPQKEYGYRNGQLLVTASASMSPPPTSGLIAYWKFDENSGTTTADSSGNGHTGTLTNGPIWTTGQTSAALSFDGTNDQVANNGIADVTNNFTLSFWAQPTATHEIDGESTSGFSGTSGQRYAFWPAWYNNGHAGVGVSVGTNGVSVYEHSDNYLPATLVYSGSLSGWTHITIVYENKQPKLYLNGTLVRTGLTSPMSFVNINPFKIGGEVYGYYGGKLDEVRVYNRALSASEVATLPNGSSSAQINWLVTDHLGTPRMVLDQTGSLANVKRHDYLPFGEELFAGTGTRIAALGYSGGDNLRQQFTQKERDIETGLDYMLARYYQGSQGRFTSADPLLASGRPKNPQSWNRYSYVLNNPVRLIDPTGYDGKDVTNPDEAQGKVSPQKPTQPNTLDLRLDPQIVSAMQEIKENAAPLKRAERPILTSVVVVEGQTSNVQNTYIIDASGTISPWAFTGTIKPIAYIPLDQACNIIPSGNGVQLREQVVPVRGPDPTATGTVMPPDNGVFIDIQSTPIGMPTIEIKQGVRVQQGRIQIDTGPNQIIKDAGAGTVSFIEGPQKKRVLP
jgi:RHS repeat-associated protein